MIWIFLSALSVAIAGTMGILMNKLVSKKQSDSLMNILGILMIFMGIQGALKIKSSLLMLISLALGTFIGSGIGIHDKAENLSNKLITKNISSETIKNAISIIIIQCSGSLSILAAMSLGLQGNPSLLQFKTGILKLSYLPATSPNLRCSQASLNPLKRISGKFSSFFGNIFSSIAFLKITSLSYFR